MLVLSRKKGESIMIGDQIELVVLGMEGDSIRLGIKAPRNVNVYRKEVYDAIRTSNQEALIPQVLPSELSKLIRKRKNVEN